MAAAYVIVGITRAIVDWRKSKLEYKVAIVDAKSRARARDTSSDIQLRQSFSEAARTRTDRIAELVDALTRAGAHS